MFKPSLAGTAYGPFENLSEFDDLSLSFAYQPIVEGRQGKIVGYEALVRGVAGQPAQVVLARIAPENRARFDQAVRLRAIREASRLKMDKPLHLNCSWLPLESVSAAVVGMLNVVSACGMARSDLVLELQSLAEYESLEALNDLRQRLKGFSVQILLDKFGESDANLARLVALRPDMVKLDRGLVAGINRSPSRQAIVSGVAAACRFLDIKLIALGVENADELDCLAANGVKLFQGFYFAEPAVNRLPEVISHSHGWAGFAAPSMAYPLADTA